MVDPLPAQVAALPERAAQLVRQLGQRISEEVTKKEKAEAKKSGKEAKPRDARQVRQLRPSEIAAVTRVSTQAEWVAFRDELDRRVRELLEQGYDVEFM